MTSPLFVTLLVVSGLGLLLAAVTYIFVKTIRGHAPRSQGPTVAPARQRQSLEESVLSWLGGGTGMQSRLRVLLPGIALAAADPLLAWLLIAANSNTPAIDQRAFWTGTTVYLGAQIVWLAHLTWQTTRPSQEPSRFRLLTVPAAARVGIWLLVSVALWWSSPWPGGQGLWMGALLVGIGLWSATVYWQWRARFLDSFAPKLAGNIRVLAGRLAHAGLSSSLVGLGAIYLFDAQVLSHRSPPATGPLLLLTFCLLAVIWHVAASGLLVRKLGSTADPVQSFGALQRIPYLLAGILLSLWLAGTGLFLLLCRNVLGMDAEPAWLLSATGFVVTPIVALLVALRHRRILHPLMRRLAERAGLRLEGAPEAPSIRTKLLAGFGTLLFFAASASFFWGYVQYRRLTTTFWHQQAVLQLDVLKERLLAAERLGPALSSQDLAGLLRRTARESDSYVYHLSPTGELVAFGPPGQRPPRLPFRARTSLRSKASGRLLLPRLRLLGAFERIHVSGQDLGAVAVLFDEARAQQPGLVGRLKTLFVFFLSILLLGALVLYRLVEEVTAPLRSMELHAEEMSRGDMHRPVPVAGERDELGNLALALERMRRNLDDKIQTIQKLNVELERKVQDRTSDLARANRELKEALETLTATKDQLVRSEKLASIGELVAGIAHELNNPTNALLNSLGPLEEMVAEVLERASDGKPSEELTEDIRRAVRVIRRAATRTRKIVAALGAYSRTDAGPPAPTDVNAAVEDALSIVSHLTVGIQVETDYGDRVHTTAWRSQLEQVFVNLLANAAQALEGRSDGRIRIQTRATQEEILVTIQDNGPGIPPEIQDKVFDPFFTTKEVGKGTGLGLSISHDIVAKHGGTITLESRPGHGATFVVRLPRRDRDSE